MAKSGQTSLQDEGSDAMNGAVDFSNPYCVLETNSKYQGHGVVCVLVLQLLLTLSLRDGVDVHYRPRKQPRMCCY